MSWAESWSHQWGCRRARSPPVLGCAARAGARVRSASPRGSAPIQSREARRRAPPSRRRRRVQPTDGEGPLGRGRSRPTRRVAAIRRRVPSATRHVVVAPAAHPRRDPGRVVLRLRRCRRKGLRFAYADRPYPGRAHYYPEREEVDHARLMSEFPDRWGLSVDLAQGMWKYHGCGAKGGPYDAAVAHQHSPRSAIDLLVTRPPATRLHNICPACARSRHQTSAQRRAKRAAPPLLATPPTLSHPRLATTPRTRCHGTRDTATSTARRRQGSLRFATAPPDGRMTVRVRFRCIDAAPPLDHVTNRCHLAGQTNCHGTVQPHTLPLPAVELRSNDSRSCQRTGVRNGGVAAMRGGTTRPRSRELRPAARRK